MDKELKQAVTFFKSETAYQKLFNQFKKKYESLGRIGGTVPSDLFSEDELNVIGGFFGTPGSRLAVKGSISITAFDEQLKDTRFAEIGLKSLLDAFFGETIVSKKQLRMEKEENMRRVVLGLRQRHKAIAYWMDYLLTNFNGNRWIWTLMDKETDVFKEMAGTLATAYQKLPDTPERLPMFSQRVTGDPHAFDLHNDLGKLLLHVLAVDTGSDMPSSTEGINELLQRYNIYRDDLLNFVTCAGFYAETTDGIHPVWRAAVKQNTTQIVPLRELVLLSRIYPARGMDVWIVENSGVCATLLDYQPDASIICTNGQFTLAALLLLDKLVEAGCVLHYAGDFDPEGLGMAQRLMERYHPGNVQLWRMDVRAYLSSNPVKELSPERLEKLNRITHEELQQVVAAMWDKGKAGYQEALVEQMVEDIQT